MRTLLHIIKKHSQLSKEATSSLVDLGQSIHENATSDELQLLITSTLTQEVYVRNACLQAIQVRYFTYIIPA